MIATIISYILIILLFLLLLYLSIKLYTSCNPKVTKTIQVKQPENIIEIPIDKVDSISAVSQGQVLVTTKLQEQYVGTIITL